MAILFSLYTLSLFTSHVAPSLTDYCDWTYEGVLLRNRLLGLSDLAHALKHYPVPNSATTLGIAVLALVFSWQLAAKLWLFLMLLLAFLVTRSMMRQRNQEKLLWLIVPAGIFLNVNLWYGFMNFQLGLCMAILVASLLRRDEQRDNVYGLLLTFTFFCHMIPFLFSGLMICLYAFQRRRLRLLWQVVPGVLLSLWYLFGRFITAHNADGDTGMFGAVRNYSAAFWAYKVNSYLKSFGFINPGTPSGSVSLRVLGPGAFLLMQLLNGILCTVFAWYLIRGALAAYREQKQERFLWSAGMIFVFFYMIAPATTLGISDPGSRLLQTALAVLLFLCGEDQTGSRMAMRLAAGCAVTLQVAALVLFIKVVLAPVQETASIPGLPRRVIVFAHVPNHVEDYFYRALERGDMRLHIFPTAMFLNTPLAEAAPQDGSQR